MPDSHLAELAGLVAIPSVGRDAAPETMRAAAGWVADQFRFASGRVEETGALRTVRAFITTGRACPATAFAVAEVLW